jgi:hypothetical protein
MKCLLLSVACLCLFSGQLRACDEGLPYGRSYGPPTVQEVVYFYPAWPSTVEVNFRPSYGGDGRSFYGNAYSGNYAHDFDRSRHFRFGFRGQVRSFNSFDRGRYYGAGQGGNARGR